MAPMCGECAAATVRFCCRRDRRSRRSGRSFRRGAAGRWGLCWPLRPSVPILHLTVQQGAAPPEPTMMSNVRPAGASHVALCERIDQTASPGARPQGESAPRALCWASSLSAECRYHYHRPMLRSEMPPSACSRKTRPMPCYVPRQTPKGPPPEPDLVDGLLYNRRDALAEKRAAHRARLAADREPIPGKASAEQAPGTPG